MSGLRHRKQNVPDTWVLCLLKIRKDLSRHELYFFPNSLLRCSLPCSHYSLPCVRSLVRALTSSSRSWLCAIKSPCCSARRKSARDLRQRIVSSGSHYPASGAVGARRWCLSSPKRLSPGIAKASACFGLGTYGAANAEGRRSRARFGTCRFKRWKWGESWQYPRSVDFTTATNDEPHEPRRSPLFMVPIKRPSGCALPPLCTINSCNASTEA